MFYPNWLHAMAPSQILQPGMKNAIFPYLHIKRNANNWLFSQKGAQMNGFSLISTYVSLDYSIWLGIKVLNMHTKADLTVFNPIQYG